ncbi:hypothetical protein U9M48_019922 [Paspalum notatum var. saurae]|uniref:MULE transposase domain-containing protein n=1 Tax=Paspalum notatum var. saurae TaxID=547442 RepID=A0AAQ3TDB6_PASNO
MAAERGENLGSAPAARAQYEETPTVHHDGPRVRAHPPAAAGGHRQGLDDGVYRFCSKPGKILDGVDPSANAPIVQNAGPSGEREDGGLVGAHTSAAATSNGQGLDAGMYSGCEEPPRHAFTDPVLIEGVGRASGNGLLITSFNYKMRKRGASGPDSRMAPMPESAVARALRNADLNNCEYVFTPSVGDEFNSCEEAKEFYNLYSWEVGFGIRYGRSRTNGNGYRTRQDIVCSCEMTMGGTSARFTKKHNHDLSVGCGEKKQWNSHGEIDPMTKEFIRKLRGNNTSIGRVCSILGVGVSSSAIPLRREVVQSVCAKLAQDDIGKTLSLLQDMRCNDRQMEVRFKLGAEGEVESMLWCTGKNKHDYQSYGDVVTFDTTYRTNLYNLPFGMFIGANNHFQSIVLGGVLLTHERTFDFEWAFSSFVEIMGGKPPVIMLTDQTFIAFIG